jgi:hypothetical protein
MTLPPLPPRANPLAKITPVTDTLLARVPDGEWLTWRRGHDATEVADKKRRAERIRQAKARTGGGGEGFGRSQAQSSRG